MLAIKKSEKSAPTCAVNVLPCRIQHNGPVNATTRHWTPDVGSDGNQNTVATAYFRGRKLTGKVLDLPEGYRGMCFLFLTLYLLSSTNPSKTDIISYLLAQQDQREKKN